MVRDVQGLAQCHQHLAAPGQGACKGGGSGKATEGRAPRPAQRAIHRRRPPDQRLFAPPRSVCKPCPCMSETRRPGSARPLDGWHLAQELNAGKVLVPQLDQQRLALFQALQRDQQPGAAAAAAAAGESVGRGVVGTGWGAEALRGPQPRLAVLRGLPHRAAAGRGSGSAAATAGRRRCSGAASRAGLTRRCRVPADHAPCGRAPLLPHGVAVAVDDARFLHVWPQRDAGKPEHGQVVGQSGAGMPALHSSALAQGAGSAQRGGVPWWLRHLPAMRARREARVARAHAGRRVCLGWDVAGGALTGRCLRSRSLLPPGPAPHALSGTGTAAVPAQLPAAARPLAPPVLLLVRTALLIGCWPLHTPTAAGAATAASLRARRTLARPRRPLARRAPAPLAAGCMAPALLAPHRRWRARRVRHVLRAQATAPRCRRCRCGRATGAVQCWAHPPVPAAGERPAASPAQQAGRRGPSSADFP